MAALFSAGDLGVVESVMKKLIAVRTFMRSRDMSDVNSDQLSRVLREAGLTAGQAQAIYQLTALSSPSDRFVMPPIQREEAMVEEVFGPEQCRGSCGLGFQKLPERGA